MQSYIPTTYEVCSREHIPKFEIASVTERNGTKNEGEENEVATILLDLRQEIANQENADHEEILIEGTVQEVELVEREENVIAPMCESIEDATSLEIGHLMEEAQEDATHPDLSTTASASRHLTGEEGA
mmetsp:Transcript_18960/g.26953  ORF Transcript_18960/g.26953 Transcript_18960/m.26953 type:complete len:129 (-) Transcript_18960:82-468(-)|eukprot:CAMPEP_0172427296 /NCGR_PEP_ID=MMETSP1064-20121228/41530_1 /TAXON_ID=202472 /ORGANISM="Aulacoseira subarctica , Strain CCAP 1002/5" /LENGTH=128 /DNA_ID=CAMNT_0013171439 /DNA_START=117 /DNA_END=503 /DNA_ORIENTATION=-